MKKLALTLLCIIMIAQPSFSEPAPRRGAERQEYIRQIGRGLDLAGCNNLTDRDVEKIAKILSAWSQTRPILALYIGEESDGQLESMAESARAAAERGLLVAIVACDQYMKREIQSFLNEVGMELRFFAGSGTLAGNAEVYQATIIGRARFEGIRRRRR